MAEQENDIFADFNIMSPDVAPPASEAPPVQAGEVQPPAAPAQPQEQPAPATAPQPQTDAPPAQPATPAEAAPPLQEKEVRGLYGAMMDEREKRQAAEKRLAEFEAQQRSQAPQSTQPLDPAVQAATWATAFNMSEAIANDRHGPDIVKAALDWALQRGAQEQSRLGFSPFALEAQTQKLPADWIVRQFQKDQALSAIGDKKPEDWAKDYAISQGWLQPDGAAPQTQQPAAAPAAAPPATAPSPRPSLASAPSAGGPAAIPVGPLAAFDALPLTG